MNIILLWRNGILYLLNSDGSLSLEFSFGLVFATNQPHHHFDQLKIVDFFALIVGEQ